MTEAETKAEMNFDNCDEVEATFVDDDSPDITDELVYDEHQWPKENPNGYSFKGKKRIFLKVVENFKVLMKKGNEKVLGNVSFKVLDSRKVPHGMEHEVELSKDKERGVAILKIFGPSAKKGCTLMINKSKKFDVKFVEILAFEVVKQLLDRFGTGDGWINLLKAVPKGPIKDSSNKKSHFCHFCNNGFCNLKNLKVHIEKYHQVVLNFTCDNCEFVSNNEADLKKHDAEKHTASPDSDDHTDKEESMETDLPTDDCKDTNKRERNKSVSNSPSPPSKKSSVEVSSLQDEVVAMAKLNLNEETVTSLNDKVAQLEKVLEKLENNHANVLNEYAVMKLEKEKLKKEISMERKEFKKVKEENAKLNLEIGKIQNEKDKNDAESMAKMKLKKIKDNTKLFNRIIESKINIGELKDINISKYIEKEECDDGEANVGSTGFGSLNNLILNKKLGGKRISPQENPALRKKNEERKQSKMFKCPQCDFLSQNETYFNEHVSKVHANQPTCPFCFKAMDSYTAVRKHCETNHTEVNNQSKFKKRDGMKKPCRFFRNGTGQCSPPSGVCDYDHSIIPDSERELCHHKRACSYKPRCIFFHPEGQENEEWKQMRNPSKICHYSLNGGTCMRSVCNFFHPASINEEVELPAWRNTSVFHPETLKKPPLLVQRKEEFRTAMDSLNKIPNLSPRISVIVKNPKKQVDQMKVLSQSLHVIKLN